MFKILIYGIFLSWQSFAMLDRKTIEDRLFNEYILAFDAQKARVKFNDEFLPPKIIQNGFFKNMVELIEAHCNLYRSNNGSGSYRKALFMAGFPGAGKSTIKKSMSGFVNIDPDEFRAELREYKRLRASGEECLKSKQKDLSSASDVELEACLIPAHDQLQPAIIAMTNLAVQCAAKGRADVAVDGTMPNKTLIAKLQQQNVIPWVVYVQVSPKMAKEGVRGRTVRGGVFVPFSKIDAFTELKLIENKIVEMKRDGVTPIITITRTEGEDFRVKEIFFPERGNKLSAKYLKFIGKSINMVGPDLWNTIAMRIYSIEDKSRTRTGKAKKYICADPLCRNFNAELRY